MRRGAFPLDRTPATAVFSFGGSIRTRLVADHGVEIHAGPASKIKDVVILLTAHLSRSRRPSRRRLGCRFLFVVVHVDLVVYFSSCLCVFIFPDVLGVVVVARQEGKEAPT